MRLCACASAENYECVGFVEYVRSNIKWLDKL